MTWPQGTYRITAFRRSSGEEAQVTFEPAAPALRYAEYAWPTEPVTGDLAGTLYPEAVQAFAPMRCPGCGLAWAEMPTGHTWRADGSECWQEDEDDDE